MDKPVSIWMTSRCSIDPLHRLLRRGGRIAALAALLAAIHPVAAADEGVVLESPRLRVEILPASRGRIASIMDKQNGVEHLEPIEIRETVLSPLVPSTIVSNHGGLEDWFWKQYVVPQTAFRLIGQGDGPDGPWATVAGNINGVNVERRMTLLKTAPAVQVDVTLRADAPLEASYWLHMVVSGKVYMDAKTGRGIVAGAFSGDPAPRQDRGMLALAQSGPQKVDIGFNDAALAPAGNWFARLALDGSAVLAVVVEDDFQEQGGFFYVWQDIKARIGSLEAVWPPKKIGHAGEIRLRYYLVVADETDPVRLDRMLNDFAARHRPAPAP